MIDLPYLKFDKNVSGSSKEAGIVTLDPPHVSQIYRAVISNPLMISLPRSGSHWALFILEGYYNKPIVFQNTPWFPHKTNETEFFIVRTHGYPPLPVENFIYLYRRDIISLFMSWAFHGGKVKVREFGTSPLNESFIYEHATTFRNSILYHLFGPQVNDKIVVTYEEMVQDTEAALKKMIIFINRNKGLSEDVDYPRLREVVDYVTPEFVQNHTWANVSEKSYPRYAELREEYKMRFGDLIWQEMTREDPRLEDLFDYRK